MHELNGRYELLVPIGRGGMGRVFLASARGGGGFERRVALKLLDERLAENAEFVRAFVEEAKLAAQIHHPNVVAVLDVGDDPAFMVMEYVEGDTLAGLLEAAESRGEKVPLRILLKILDDALAGLHAAHELTDEGGAALGVIHRDFSPHNVLVGADGVAKLSDFGIAKVSTRGDRTAAGVVKGKLGYMSPEQLTGKKLDRRSDVWAAGVVVWEAIAGQRLVADEGPSLTDDPPRLRTAAPEAPEALERALAQALTVEVDDRVRTVAELRRQILAAAGTPPAPPGDVASYVRRILGDTLRQRTRAVAEVLAARADAPAKVAIVEPKHEETVRYAPLAPLGEGGMGRVLLVRDQAVGREVALKELLPEARGHRPAEERFRREARLQGQLEHPAVVPVYDIGTTPDGAPFFTMKRVRGEALSSVLQRLAAGDEATLVRYTRRRLLSSFVQLCLAIHYAHERGVIHRDIKPDNVMLGEYGEVYVLDWGVAKVVGEEDSGEALVGSFRTMSPEQASGSEVDARADVYSLGAVLFELLTLAPLHDIAAPPEMIASILKGVDARPSVRASEKEVPPELERLCVATTTKDRSERLGTARELAEAIEKFLDGDRDLELRREAAELHATQAAAATTELLDGKKGTDEHVARRAALGEVGRALAFDASNRDALKTLVRLLTNPPRETPREVIEQRWVTGKAQLRLGALSAMAAYSYIMLNGTLLRSVATYDVHRAWVIEVVWIAAIASSIFAAFRPSNKSIFTVFLCGLAGSTLSTNAFSPFLIVPGLLQVHCILFAMMRPRLARLIVIMCSAVAWTICVLGVASGWFENTFHDVDGTVCLSSAIYQFPPGFLLKFLYASGLGTLVLPAIVVGLVRRSFDVADMRLRVQAWQLERLVPDA